MGTFKIDLKKSFEEIEIGERIFKMDTSDEKLKQYVSLYTKYMKEEARIKEKEEAIQTENAQEAFNDLHEEIKALLKETLDFMLEDGAFDYVYETTGSINSVASVVVQLSTFISGKLNDSKQDNLDYYLNRNNKGGKATSKRKNK